MKSLRDRLAQFDHAPTSGTRAAQHVDRMESCRALGFHERSPGHWVFEQEVELPFEFDSEAVATLLGAAAPAGRWAIVDTETTGLESGTGTMVFLIAVLHLSHAGGPARLRQHFLADLHGEASMLAAGFAELEDCSMLLSYNGKSFDLPRLRARAALQRQDVRALDLPHLDLVHPMRRLAREWLSDVRLATVEREILGIHRVADIPGALVPAVYREWLQRSESRDLDGVMRHNRLDVLHLAQLLARMGDWLHEPTAAALPASLRLALGRLLEQRGAHAVADRCYQTVAADDDARCRRRALWGSARLARRRGDSARARELWQALIAERPDWIPARIEMAKLLEHQLRDPRAAREETRVALSILAEDRLQPLPRRREQRERLLHRLNRLEGKCARGAAR